MNYAQKLAAQIRIRPEQAASAIELLDADNTIPFIARYRKEATGGLTDEQLFLLQETLNKMRSLDERREAVIKSIEEQGKLTPQLLEQLNKAETLTALEDLYQPYRPKRKTRASVARERGLQPLADLILAQAKGTPPVDEIARAYLCEAVGSVQEALDGARDIVAEAISDHPEVRRITREKALQWGGVRSEKNPDVEDARRVYELYYAADLRVDRLRSHQVLAINRGEAEKVLRVHLQVPERDWQAAIAANFRVDPRSPFAGLLTEAANDAAERLLLPAIERDVRRVLTEKAEEAAIQVFAENLRSLLSQPPIARRTVLGLDPGFRTGCKLAVVDDTSRVLATGNIYPHEPQKRWNEAIQNLASLITRHHVTLIAIGNGTASRETEQLVVELIQLLRRDQRELQYLMVNEAGASVYSASALARSELPDLDVSLRGAVSIARRVQDPLAELVKIDPKSIGVGMYQHDVDQKRLANTLQAVVESVVNRVGVDVNTASPALLTYVAGIGPKLAEKLISYRNEGGPFKQRSELRKVSGLGPKAFEQAAGFLRIQDGEEPLDATAIHPESYQAALLLLDLAGVASSSSLRARQQALDALLGKTSIKELAARLGTGEPTLVDILEQLRRPGRDPRQDLPAPILRSDVLKMEDLVTGMRLRGTVRNVVDFGVFVDIGVKQDGLLHRSQLPAGLVLKVGDIIEVEIRSVEKERGRISLGWASA